MHNGDLAFGNPRGFFFEGGVGGGEYSYIILHVLGVGWITVTL